MYRTFRIMYPDAWYHVMNRRRRREQIFESKKRLIRKWLKMGILGKDDKVNTEAQSWATGCLVQLSGNRPQKGMLDVCHPMGIIARGLKEPGKIDE